MNLLRRALGIVLLVLCGVIGGFLASRHWQLGNRGAVGATLAEPATAATLPAAAAPKASAAAIPASIPAAQLPDLAGKEHSLRDYLGHPLIINFWATWCPPCRREMPLLQQLWSLQHGRDGLTIVGVAVDTRDAVQQYLKTTMVGYPLLVGEQQGSEAVAKFGIEPVLPFSVFADARGQIVAVKIGELHRTEADFIVGQLDALNAGRTTLAQARASISAEMRRLAIGRAKQSASPATPSGDPATPATPATPAS